MRENKEQADKLRGLKFMEDNKHKLRKILVGCTVQPVSVAGAQPVEDYQFQHF